MNKCIWPKVSIIWLNYNSMHVIDVVLKSLEAISNLDYPNFELIIVDNGSIDGSENVISKFVYEKLKDEINVRIIRLRQNFGFTGGNNIGYRLRDPDSKYVMLINNDCIIYPKSLKQLVKILEEHEDIGAIQGVVVGMGVKSGIIDSAGGFLNETLDITFPYNGKHISSLSRSIIVTFIEGTMPIYRVHAIKESVGENMFPSCGFMYFLEDVFLSLKMWNKGYKSIVVPIVCGEHFRQAIIKRYRSSIHLNYYSIRNHIALIEMTNYRRIVKILKYLVWIRKAILNRLNIEAKKECTSGWLRGIELGKKLKRSYGVIDMYKSPFYKPGIRKIIKQIIPKIH